MVGIGGTVILLNGIKKNKYIKIAIKPAFFVETVLILMLLISFPYIGNVTQIIMKIVPIWAAIILLLNIKSFKSIIRTEFYWILICFCVSYLITIFLNRQSNIIQNTKSLIWFIIYIGILLVWWKYKKVDEKIIKKNIWKINMIVIVVNLLNTLPSVIIYIANICIRFQDRPIGIYTGRLFGIMAGINPSAMIALVSIMAVLMNVDLKQDNNKSIIIIYRVNIILSYIFIIASGTRSVRLIMIFLIGFTGFVYLWRRWLLLERFNSKIIAAICSILCSGLIMCVSYIGVEGSRYPIGMLPMLGKSMGIINVYENAENTENTDISKSNIENFFDNAVVRDKENGERSSLHRINIAKESMLLWRNFPIFGIGSANMNEYASNSNEVYEYLINPPYGVSTHSMPIAVLLFSGLCGIMILGTYLTLMMIKSIFLLLQDESIFSKVGKSMLFAVIICMSLCIYSLAGTIIIFNNVECTILFWIYLGIVSEMKQLLLNQEE